MMPALTLACGTNQVQVRPDTGAAIEQFSWRGMDILRPTPPDATTVRQMASFPLVPYANRIGSARLPGHAPLRLNFLPEPHSLHGFGWQRPWQVSAASANTARLQLIHAKDQDWPFDCVCTLDIMLDMESLHLRLTLRNTDLRDMPAGLGFHPFFPLDADTRLTARWEGMWETENQLPVRHVAVPAAAQKALANWQVDHCFTDWNGSAVLDYASHRVVLAAGGQCPNLQCYRPGDGRPFIALEPVSHIPNAHQLAESGNPDTGLRTLSSGQSFEISMSITVKARVSEKENQP